MIRNNTNLTMENEEEIEEEERQDSLEEKHDSSEDDDASEVEGESTPVIDVASVEKEELRKKTIPQPGLGQRISEIDPMLMRFREHLDYRWDVIMNKLDLLFILLD